MTPARAPTRSLAPRLLGAFVAVALLGIAVLAVLVAGGLQTGAQRVVAAERQQVTNSVAGSAGAAYEEAGGWAGADLGGAAARAADAGASLVIRNAAGFAVAAFTSTGEPVERPGRGQGHPMGLADGGRPVIAPVVVDGADVGAVSLRFPTSAGVSSRTLAALWLWIGLAAAAALVVAVVVAVVVTRRITRPLQHLSEAVARIGGGDRGVVLHPADFPGELGTVADAVTLLARDLDTQDRLRRAALSDVTHELRTPVAILQGYLEEMVDGVSAPDPQRLSLLHDEVLRIGRLISDLEVLREAETAGLSLRSGPVDLAVIAGRATDALQGPAAEQGTVLRRELAPAPARGDAARLAQVVLNLLSNALKHGGGETVSISTTRGDAGTAVLEVRDHGPGIPAEELPHVFDRYWRGAAAGRTSGSGVGLAVVREIVAAHGGTVLAMPTPGGGTTMRVVLPS